MWKVQLFKLNYDSREAQAVSKVLESGWLTMGENIQAFESAFSQYLGDDVSSTATASGTAALHMALLALGIGSGDEIIIPSLTFVADINTVMLTGAMPVLADCTSLSNWNIDPGDIERKITKKTKAVLIVHYAGYSCDMEPISDICKRHGLKLIEDCAHAPGATYRNKKVGTFGDVGCFSFFTNKNLSIGEGGMYVTSNLALDKKGKFLRSHGMTSLTLDRHKGRASSYDVIQPGLNYRMDEMRAALGLVQLDKLIEANQRRKELVDYYCKLLKEFDGISIPYMDFDFGKPSYHIFPLLLDNGIDRKAVMSSLKEQGIQSSIHYPPFQEFTAYKSLGLDLTPKAFDISQRELTLPLYSTMGFDEVETVCDALKISLT